MRSILLGGMVAAILVLPARSQAQEVRADFAQTLRNVRQGVFLVGRPNIGTAPPGSSLASIACWPPNAHVADFFARKKPGEKCWP